MIDQSYSKVKEDEDTVLFQSCIEETGLDRDVKLLKDISYISCHEISDPQELKKLILLQANQDRILFLSKIEAQINLFVLTMKQKGWSVEQKYLDWVTGNLYSCAFEDLTDLATIKELNKILDQKVLAGFVERPLSLSNNAQSSLDIIASMLDPDVEIHKQKFADLSPLLMEQELQAILLQEEQIELINKIERKITLCALQKAQNGEVINVKEHVEKISAYIYKLNRKQIKEVDYGLGQIVDLQNAVGDFTITPTAFPMTAQFVLHFLVTTFGSYLVTKAIVDTQDALNKHQSDPEDRLHPCHLSKAISKKQAKNFML